MNTDVRGCSGQKEKRRNKGTMTLPNDKLKDNENLHMDSQFSCFILCCIVIIEVFVKM